MLDAKAKERFWSKVNVPAGKDACWEWTAWTAGGCGHQPPYGYFHLNGRAFRAHRVAYMMVCGAIPDGYEVAHSCDNPRCVRPDHLHLATRQENQHEKALRGRGAGGVHRLSPEKARCIHLYSRLGMSGMKLAKLYGVTAVAIYQVLSGQSYRVVYDEVNAVLATLPPAA